MVSLPDLADKLNQHGLLQKSFMDMSKTEIMLLVEAVMSSPDDVIPPDGWNNPHIYNGELIITFDSHPKYHWWTPDGQGIMATLVELDAPWEVAKKYVNPRMTEQDYLNRLIPF